MRSISRYLFNGKEIEKDCSAAYASIGPGDRGVNRGIRLRGLQRELVRVLSEPMTLQEPIERRPVDIREPRRSRHVASRALDEPRDILLFERGKDLVLCHVIC